MLSNSENSATGRHLYFTVVCFSHSWLHKAPRWISRSTTFAAVFSAFALVRADDGMTHQSLYRPPDCESHSVPTSRTRPASFPAQLDQLVS
jgi:hypothetical protein